MSDRDELARDAALLLLEALPILAEEEPEPLDAEAVAVVYGLPWTAGDHSAETTDMLVGAVERAGSVHPDEAVDLLRAIAALFPQAAEAALEGAGRVGGDGRRTPAVLGCGPAWAAAAGAAQVVAIVVEVGDDLAVPGYVILERDGGTVGGGLRDAPRPRDEVAEQVEAFVNGLDGVTRLAPPAARERVRRLLVTASEKGLPQRESFARDRPLLALALGDDLRTWPQLELVADEAVEGPRQAAEPPAPRDAHGRAAPPSASERRRRDKRRQAKAARRRNRG